MKIALNSHASQTNTLPSRSKSLRTDQNLSKSMPAQTHGKIADLNKTKISATTERKCLEMNKVQHTTRYVKHLAESANFKASTFNKLCNGLIGNRFEMPNVSNTHPLWWRISNSY